ncbi:MAG TPA: polysaccharide deacetylase family protein [Candidatus Saccharimonadia bacterium]|nr:polysaccharide deacetylase family protein [Candidatus Saccharimonadia bacterium]
MKLNKLTVTILILTLLAGAGSYTAGRSGFNFARAIVESRCSAGAFIAHAKSASELAADAHTTTSAAPSNVSGQTAEATYRPIALTSANLIANGDAEIRTATAPKGWSTSVFGKNDGRFSTVAGYNSPTGLRVDITQFTDGTANWLSPNLAAVPGGYYQYQDYYRSNVPTAAVLMLKDAAGKQQFLKLDSAPPSDQWTSYTQRFFVPVGTAEIRLSHPLDSAGWLETDAHILQTATAPPLAEPLLSLTFDDGWSSIYANALPLMTRYGMVSTQYLVSGYLGAPKSYMSPGQIYKFLDQGHEIASHTIDHPDLTTLGDKELKRQLQTSRQGLSKCYAPTTDFAAPYGANNGHTLIAEKAAYQTSRSTEAGYNSLDTFDPYRLKVQNIQVGTTPAQIQAWLATAVANHTWLILVYHQVDTSGGAFSRRPVDFEADLQAIKASGITVKTVHDAYTTVHQQASTP